MKSISELIGDLLLQNNCVIVPSFGGFVAKRVPSSIDFTSGLMLPPSKSLLFNKQLVNNDGLLINELAKNRKVNFDQAERILREEISNWSIRLNNGERIDIDRVGRIYLDQEKNFCFEQDRFYNLLLESYGLKKVHFLTEEDVEIVEKTLEILDNYIPVQQPIVEDVSLVKDEETILAEKVEPIEEKVELEKVIPILPKVDTPPIEKVEQKVIPINKGKNNAWRYIAAACLLPIAFYSFWIPLKTDVLESGVVSWNDFNPFYEHKEASYTEKPIAKFNIPEVTKGELVDSLHAIPSETNVYTLKYDSAHYIQVNIDQNFDSDEQEVKIQKEDVNNPSSGSTFNPDAMNYIVGCFGNKANAQRFVKQLQKEGFDAHIVDKSNGLHRVSAGSALSEQQLNAIAAKSKEKGHPGWVLRK